MKFIERIRKCIKDNHISNGEEKYYVKAYDLLGYLKENEVDIPHKYIEKDKYGLCSGALGYMEKLTGLDTYYLAGDNTYDWNGKIDFDLYFYEGEGLKGGYYVALQVYLGTGKDNIYNHFSDDYSDYCLLKFKCAEDFYKIIKDYSHKQCFFEYNFKGYSFYVVPTIFSEYLYVNCSQLEIETTDKIWASTDKELEFQLDKWLKIEKELVVPNPFHYNVVRRQGGLDIEIYNTQIPDLKASTTTMFKGEYVQEYFDIDKLWQVNVVNEEGKFEKHIYIEGWQNVIKQLKENKKKVNKK